MNKIYEIINKIFNSSSGFNQVDLLSEADRHISNALYSKDNNILNQALEESSFHNNEPVRYQIFKMINKNVNQIEILRENKKITSLLILIPYVITSIETEAYLPPMKVMEEWFRTELYNNGLIADYNQFNLAPVLLTELHTANIGYGEWFNLHNAQAIFVEQKYKREIFEYPFKIKIDNNRPQLNFLLANITIPHNIIVEQPKLLSESNTYESLIEDSLNKISNMFNSNIDNTMWEFIGIHHPIEILPKAYEVYQNVLINYFIKIYSLNANVKIILLPTDKQEGFVLAAWHVNKNLILDILILYPFLKELGDIVDYIKDSLAVIEVLELPIGNENISLNEMKNINKYDAGLYSRKYGFSILSTV